MHVLWTSALEWQMILGQGAACCRQIRSMEKSILTILTLDGVRVENLPCFGIWGVLRHNPGESNLMFWWREPEVVCPPVFSSLRFVW
jgi:hypothetical protein